MLRLVGDNTDGLAIDPRPCGDDVAAIKFLVMKDLSAVDEQFDQLIHIVSAAHIFRNDFCNFFAPFRGFYRCRFWFGPEWQFPAVVGEIGQELPDGPQAVFVIFRHVIDLAGNFGCFLGAANLIR